MKNHVLFGLIYTVIYCFLAFWNVGPEGKGTTIFFAPILPWVFFLIALIILKKADDLMNRIFFVGVMIAHYGLTLLFLYAASSGTYRGKTNFMWGWEQQPDLFVLTVIWYLLGQIIIWSAFLKCLYNRAADV